MKMQKARLTKTLLKEIGRIDTNWLQNLEYTWSNQKSIE